MSGSSLALKRSSYKRGLLLLAGLAVLLVYSQLPVTGIGFWLSLPLLVLSYYLLLQRWQQPPCAQALLLQDNGGISWLQSALPAGQLCSPCLISQYAIVLSWHTEQRQRQQYWVCRDELSEQDYRALARQLQCWRWQFARQQAGT